MWAQKLKKCLFQKQIDVERIIYMKLLIRKVVITFKGLHRTTTKLFSPRTEFHSQLICILMTTTAIADINLIHTRRLRMSSKVRVGKSDAASRFDAYISEEVRGDELRQGR